ncbi:MAG TPA: KOW motif-containing protein [Pyrinomonadaceae bacterium]|jgi:transcriptional antiterminator NusG
MTEDIFGFISGDRPSKKIRRAQTFRLGDNVRIISGAFAGFTGKIEGINKDKSLLLVRVAIAGRTQAIKINFTDAENE